MPRKRNRSDSERPQPENDPSEQPSTTGHGYSLLRSQLLFLLQGGICLLTVLFALIAKAVGGTFYARIATWYFDTVNDTVWTGTFDPAPLFQNDTDITETSLLTTEKHVPSDLPDFEKPMRQGTLTSFYGERTLQGKTSFHKGIDISADKNTEITAMLEGTVTAAEENAAYGKYLVLQHEGGWETLYARCEKLLVHQGETVQKGEVIALSGDSGGEDGCHLHLEIRQNGVNVDPAAAVGDAFS